MAGLLADDEGRGGRSGRGAAVTVGAVRGQYRRDQGSNRRVARGVGVAVVDLGRAKQAALVEQGAGEGGLRELERRVGSGKPRPDGGDVGASELERRSARDEEACEEERISGLPSIRPKMIDFEAQTANFFDTGLRGAAFSRGSCTASRT